MPMSEQLRKMVAEGKIKKKRPRAESWTAGKRWDRLKTVKQKLETLHGENEVQYALFVVYPNPRGDPSHYLFKEGEDIEKLVNENMLFNKNFLHLKPAWKNPPQFNQEPIVKKKRKIPKLMKMNYRIPTEILIVQLMFMKLMIAFQYLPIQKNVIKKS
ncbi:hypothetical protein OUZ56_008248 [Daphnia magna]|uniref:Uncharacterized protein n=1 Tax=Daphnia magna TaxID=35525 RepID=A0ABR0ACE1_9CRUS|nr:hypothetical protein OUZ56_008248 [Daphnia magna]